MLGDVCGRPLGLLLSLLDQDYKKDATLSDAGITCSLEEPKAQRS